MSYRARRRLGGDLGRAIRSIRKRRDLSQGELGAKLGCPAHTVCQYELGTARPSVARLFAILREAKGEERDPILKALEARGVPASILQALITADPSSTASVCGARSREAMSECRESSDIQVGIPGGGEA
jgi:transcriptional regulator with XRE-family HTH domain